MLHLAQARAAGGPATSVAARTPVAALRVEDVTFPGELHHGRLTDQVRQHVHQMADRRALVSPDIADAALQQRLGRSPAETEIAGELGVPIDEYHHMLLDARGAQLVHYEDFTDGEDGNFLERNCADDSADPLASLLDGDLRQALIGAIGNLPEREKTLMGLYYEQELNFKEIGAVLGVSESRVCQIHSQAVARLRAKLKECALKKPAKAGFLVRGR